MSIYCCKELKFAATFTLRLDVDWSLAADENALEGLGIITLLLDMYCSFLKIILYLH